MIQIYDTTLRDGSQRNDISLSRNNKIDIAIKLDDLGFTFIEGGWPGSNPKDAEFFERAKDLEWKNALISAFGSTCRVKGGPEDDANIKALIDSQAPVCTVFGKTWTLHVKEVLRTTLDENLRIIQDSLAYLKAHNRRVIYDAEHFFDGYKADPAYAIETLKAAVRGGAETLVLCDTNGGLMPWEVSKIIQDVKNQVNHPLGIHTHNDGDSAVANALLAIQEGCIQVQGTINGYGERCGNANLCTIIPSLELKMGIPCLPSGNLPKLYELSHFVSDLANLYMDEHMAYVGKYAFAHKGGVHVAAMRRSEKSYQHIEPQLVGNKMRVVISEYSGRGNLFTKAEEYQMEGVSSDHVVDVLDKIKELESIGFSFESAEASAMMLLKRKQHGYTPPFELIDFTAIVEHRQGRGIFVEATVKVKIGNEILHTAGEGNGPVSALDQALRKALVKHYPNIEHFHLVDYKVRILDGNSGTSAITRVLIDTQNGSGHWTTVGASTNIIEASWQALADSIEYGLTIGAGG